MNVRLYGIDCPEGNQASGREAWIFASKLANGSQVEVQPIDIDRYGRTVATVHVNGRSINEELIRSGHAWVYTQYCTNDFCHDWLKLQSDSQGARSGLWAAKTPTPPWDFRHSLNLAQATPQSPKPKPPPASAAPYHGNVSSLIFHDSSCQHYDCKACTAAFTTRQQALDAGRLQILQKVRRKMTPTSVCKQFINNSHPKHPAPLLITKTQFQPQNPHPQPTHELRFAHTQNFPIPRIHTKSRQIPKHPQNHQTQCNFLPFLNRCRRLRLLVALTGIPLPCARSGIRCQGFWGVPWKSKIRAELGASLGQNGDRRRSKCLGHIRS